jgi:hypothetical protein
MLATISDRPSILTSCSDPVSIIKKSYYQALPLGSNLHGCKDGSRHINPSLDGPHPSLLGHANELGKLQRASSGNDCYNNRGHSGNAKLSVQEKDGYCRLDW